MHRNTVAVLLAAWVLCGCARPRLKLPKLVERKDPRRALLLNQLPDIEAEDNVGTARSLSEYRGMPVVLLVVSACYTEDTLPWAKAVRERYGEAVKVLIVADLKSVRFGRRGKSEAASVAAMPYGYTLLFDRTGDVMKSLYLVGSGPHAIVADAGGRVIHVGSGRFSWKRRQELFFALDGVARAEKRAAEPRAPSISPASPGGG